MRVTRLLIEGLNRHGDGEISLAGSRGADAEDQIVALDGFQITALRDRFRSENLLAEAALLSAFEKAAQRHFGIGGNHAQQAVQIAILENDAFANEREIILQNTFGTRYGFGFALDFEGVLPQPGADIQTGFEQADVFVARAEEAFNAAANLNCGFHLFGATTSGKCLWEVQTSGGLKRGKRMAWRRGTMMPRGRGEGKYHPLLL